MSRVESSHDRQAKNLEMLMRYQNQYDATHGTGGQAVNPAMTMDGSIFGQNGNSMDVGSMIGQTFLKAGVSKVLDLLKEAAKSTGKQLISKVAGDGKDAGKNTAEVGKDKLDLSLVTKQVEKELTDANVSLEKMTALYEALSAIIEEKSGNIDKNSEVIDKNNSGINTNKQNIEKDEQELASLYGENDEGFDPLDRKLILGSEMDSSGPFNIKKFDSDGVSKPGSGNGAHKKHEKTPKASNTQNGSNKGNKLNKSKKAEALVQDIQENQDQMRTKTAENQVTVEQINNDLMIERENMEGNEELIAQMSDLQNKNNETMTNANTGHTTTQADEMQDSGSSVKNAGDGTGDVILSTKELVMGDGLLVAGIPLLATPPTAPIGQEAEVKGGEKVATGTATAAPSAAVVGHETGNIANFAGLFAQNIMSWGMETVSSTILASATGQSIDGASIAQSFANSAIDTGTQAITGAITGFGSKENPKKKIA